TFGPGNKTGIPTENAVVVPASDEITSPKSYGIQVPPALRSNKVTKPIRILDPISMRNEFPSNEPSVFTDSYQVSRVPFSHNIASKSHSRQPFVRQAQRRLNVFELKDWECPLRVQHTARHQNS